MDYNSTTPCDPRIVEAMLPYFTERFGNAASHTHSFGWEAAEAIKVAREQIASLIGCDPGEIFFTSGATEANNLALKGAFESYAGKGNHIITTAIEHKSVLDTCSHLEKRGADITYLKVDGKGVIDGSELISAVRKDTILIAIMYANNETGNLMPVSQIAAIAKERNILFFTDAAQAVGKIPVKVQRDGIDILSIAAHKLYGPKGVGAIYIRRRGPRVKLIPQMDGGGHEKGMRSGTLNVPGIVGLGKACEIASMEMMKDEHRLGILRDQLEAGLLKLEGTRINGNPQQRLAHVTNIAFEGLEGDSLITNLGRQIAVSSGSACTSASPEPSHVLKAMALDDKLAHSSIRFSLGKFTNKEEIDWAIEEITKTVKELRALGNLITTDN